LFLWVLAQRQRSRQNERSRLSTQFRVYLLFVEKVAFLLTVALRHTLKQEFVSRNSIALIRHTLRSKPTREGVSPGAHLGGTQMAGRTRKGCFGRTAPPHRIRPVMCCRDVFERLESHDMEKEWPLLPAVVSSRSWAEQTLQVSLPRQPQDGVLHSVISSQIR